MIKFVKCIENSIHGYPSIKGKVYKVLKERTAAYFLHNINKQGEMKSRFIEVQLNEKIANILYG